MKTAWEVADKSQPSELKFSQHLLLDLKAILPQFEQAVTQYANSRVLQSSISAQMSEVGRQARLYLSHFIQVFNMCIARGEIKADMRLLLCLEEYGATVPELATDKQLLDWGKKIIDGEEQRMAQNGGNRIYNPSIAVVKVKISQFEEMYHKHRDILQTIQKHHTKLDSLRARVDQLILDLWNDIEASLSPLDDERRAECVRYGVAYFYRPQERQKEFMNGSLAEV